MLSPARFREDTIRVPPFYFDKIPLKEIVNTFCRAEINYFHLLTIVLT
jgi:hypothetical protein